MNPKNWNNPKYQRINSAEVKGKEIVVKFEDSSVVAIDSDILLPAGAHSPDWNSMQFTPYELTLMTSLGETEIPWSTIRLISDADFAAHWAQKAEEQAKDIGQRIRELRRSKNLTSKDVAERAGISPQSLSRIEKGRHDVVFTTLRKILAAMGCTLQDLATVQVVPVSVASLIKRLEAIGIKKEWMLDRILPPDLASGFDTAVSNAQLFNRVAEYISQIYKWTPEEILGDTPLVFDSNLIQGIRFKGIPRSQEKQIYAYALFAHHISSLILQAVPHLEARPLPDNPNQIRREIAESFGPLNLENVLLYVWGHGIPVIPLSDSGSFHGACWRISGKTIIILKQVTRYQGRWLFDIAHEMGHVVRNLKKSKTGFIEDREITPFDEDEYEVEANNFATDLLFSGRAEELIELVVKQAKSKAEFLKSAIIQVAADEQFPIDILANYLAFRLSKTDNINWWPTANNLQVSEPSPHSIAKRILLDKVDISKLSPEDQRLLIRTFA